MLIYSWTGSTIKNSFFTSKNIKKIYLFLHNLERHWNKTWIKHKTIFRPTVLHRYFFKTGLHPAEFVNTMRNKGELIMGIGHRVKSINNPDQRVKIVKEFVIENFPATPLLHYALEVEKLTTSKKPNLILNVDGVIACSFVDMLRNCGSFTR